MPPNVISSSLISHLKSNHSQIFALETINEILDKIDKLLLDPSLTIKEHIRSLQERYRSTTICPKCGAQLVKRTAKKGYDANSNFLGCTSYPRCRFTKKIS